jgi:OmpA-OmpF porin, OOP family
MKKVLTSLVLFILVCGTASAQENARLRPASLGISYILNDYKTAALIRSTSFGAVRANDQWTPMKDQSPGLALHYFKGIKSHLDFAATLAASYVRYAAGSEQNPSSDGLLVEADASGNFKLFSEDYFITPYINAGVGASVYKQYWGAFIPLGLGLKVNLFHESDIFLTFQYRIPVTKETAGYHFMTGIGITGLLGKPGE